jgi:hypothetical protein
VAVEVGLDLVGVAQEAAEGAQESAAVQAGPESAVEVRRAPRPGNG